MLTLEHLESRNCPAPFAVLQGGLLTVGADNFGDYLVVTQPNPTTVEVFDAINYQTFDFPSAQVQMLLFQGGQGGHGDSFYNLTSFPSWQMAGANSGVNYLQGGSSNDMLYGDPNRAGQTYFTDFAGNNGMFGGPGLNNFFGLNGNEQIVAGSGPNAIYDILGTNNINASQGFGYVITNAASTVTASSAYAVVTFFQPTFGPPGNPPVTTPPVVLQQDVNGNGILYLIPQKPSAAYEIDDFGGVTGKLYVNYADANGFQSFQFPEAGVKWLAEFGGNGNNTTINNTNINDVFYGGIGGSHFLVGGFGINILKGHAGPNVARQGNSTIIARGWYNDLTAGSANDTIYGSQAGQNVFRANQQFVSTVINGFQNMPQGGPPFLARTNRSNSADLIFGVPFSTNNVVDPNDIDASADNDDFAFWAGLLY